MADRVTQRLTRADRITASRDVEAVFAQRHLAPSGPLRVHARRTDGPRMRLALAVSRRVGGAVRRNRIKRSLREAFRRGRARWPVGWDIVVVVHPHPPMPVAQYASHLDAAIVKLVGADA